MKIRVMDDVFKDDMRLYMEHIWVDHHVCPAERKYIALAYIAYGSGTVIIGNERFDASAKDIFVVLPGIKAEFISRNMSAENYDLEIHYIFFEKGFLRGEWERYGEEFSDLERFFDGTGQYYIKAADNEMSEIRNYIVRMTNEYYEYAPGRESALFGQLLSILPIVFRHHNVKEERLFSRNMLVDQTIRQIRHTIYSNPKPGEIAAHRFVTTDHLGRVFKKETGMTVTQYINQLRVDITKDILQNTDRPIENIPMLFNIKLKYLQQIFKKYTGMSMREYRRLHHYR